MRNWESQIFKSKGTCPFNTSSPLDLPRLSLTIHRCTLFPLLSSCYSRNELNYKVAHEGSINHCPTDQLQQNAINPKNSQIQYRRPENTATDKSTFQPVNMPQWWGLTVMNNILTPIYGRMKETQLWHYQFTSH